MFKGLAPLAAAVAATAALTISAASAGTATTYGFAGYPLATWTDGSVHSLWNAVYNGYGNTSVVVDSASVGRTLQLRPKTALTVNETHAGLATTTAVLGNMDTTVQLKTVRQLRATPNTWEVGWVLWHYTDDTHFYYFVPKANGWELGKEDPAYPGAQRFLATGSNVKFPVGAWYTVRVQQVGATMTVWVNGAQIVSFTDGERPYAAGSIGLYCEDSQVRFANVSVGVL